MLFKMSPVLDTGPGTDPGPALVSTSVKWANNT